ncbi:hypothetical protein HFP57_13380 [Parasphingopyxis algicola]|uniref:hypothetical protein n=1 Tax=Parasphingopyxis algicola TaxID=2026624 RepID=UPI0015A0658B|nr:hypothetical protein [Parasphingopyxis algicola]QLC25917.1 hypothetical protein HFP57_13380 [Parasphingopyxis algicola]
MHSRLHTQLAALALLPLVAGCVQATRHSNTMIFGTNTTVGLKVGTNATQMPEIMLAYDRQEAVILPLVANTVDRSRAPDNRLQPCDLTRNVTASGTRYAVHPCSLVAFRGGAMDSYSVLASFGAEFEASSGSSPEASGGLAQYFATGMAAQVLAATGGAAVVATGAAADEAARQNDGNTLATLLTGSSAFSQGEGLSERHQAFEPTLVAAIRNTNAEQLADRLQSFERRAGVMLGGAAACASRTPDQCADFIDARDFYADDYRVNPDAFEEALSRWDEA